MRSHAGAVTVLGAILVLGSIWLVFSPSITRAYPQYSDGSDTANCAQCHEAAPGGFQSRGPLHDTHNASATGTCLLCHTQTGDIPQMTSSGDPNGHGCMGCHGQVIGGVTTGVGLRAHHVAKGVVDGNGLQCSDCHNDPAASPESSPPPYYGRADVVQASTCNTDGMEDFWNVTTGLPDGLGLDNDGDLTADVHDSDCAASYEVRNDGFKEPTNHDRYSWDAQLPPGQVFDVIRSDGALFPAVSPNTLCLMNDASVLFVDDTVAVPLGRCFYYLVRNTLVSDYGKRSDGTSRTYPICP